MDYFRRPDLIEKAHSIFLGTDGKMHLLLTPISIFIERSFGHLFQGIACGLCVLFLLSFRKQSLGRVDVISIIAVVQCAVITSYAVYTAYLFNGLWNRWIQKMVQP